MLGKTVWVVQYANRYSDAMVSGVFDSEEKAKEHKEAQRFPGNYEIYELEVG